MKDDDYYTDRIGDMNDEIDSLNRRISKLEEALQAIVDLDDKLSLPEDAMTFFNKSCSIASEVLKNK